MRQQFFEKPVGHTTIITDKTTALATCSRAGMLLRILSFFSKLFGCDLLFSQNFLFLTHLQNTRYAYKI